MIAFNMNDILTDKPVNKKNTTGFIGSVISAVTTSLIASINKEIADDQLKLQKQIANLQLSLNKSVADVNVRVLNLKTSNVEQIGKIDITIADAISEMTLLQNELAKEIVVAELQERKAEKAIENKTLPILQENFGLPTTQEVAKQTAVVEQTQVIANQVPPAKKKTNKLLIIGGIATVAGIGFLFLRNKKNE